MKDVSDLPFTSGPSQRPPGEVGDARRAAAQPALTTLLLLSLQRDGQPYEGTWRVDWFHTIRSTTGVTAGRWEGSGSAVQIAVDAPGPYRVNVRGTDWATDGWVGTDVVPARFDASETPVIITLHPTSWLIGSVVDHLGMPLRGIRVWFHPAPGSTPLERPDPSGRSAFSAEETGEGGMFGFDIGTARAGQLRVGDQMHPWVPPIEIRLVDRYVQLDPIRVELFAVTFIVRAADGSPLEGARLEGTGLEGGHFATTTDPEGRARVEQMPRGRWRVLAQHAEHGRANRAVEVPLGKDEPVVLVLPR